MVRAAVRQDALVFRRKPRPEIPNPTSVAASAPPGVALDASGFIADAPTAPKATSTLGPDGRGRTYFQQAALQDALWSYGEDGLADVVRGGLDRDIVEAIGTRHAELMSAALSRPVNHAPDQALAMAAVEVMEGEARPLARNRRRSKQ